MQSPPHFPFPQPSHTVGFSNLVKFPVSGVWDLWEAPGELRVTLGPSIKGGQTLAVTTHLKNVGHRGE